MIWFVPSVVLIGIVGLVSWMQNASVAHHRKKWYLHEIYDYDISMRHEGVFNYVGNELGDGVTLIVRDGILVDVHANFPIDNIAAYDIYTIDNLFQHVGFEAQYDAVYGFPMRIVGWRGYSIEVTNFKPYTEIDY